ncbi:Hypothetical protein ORPV_631 [Orpheovirus IHUMI-LCC2]|uniref:Uncharacterized protein n=1 Tax=Orpheovirus IHUMI-LCC2 TaxID=2023057 RepID=A0A2I2L4P9_9VIRU|nr:Hypothetical protein ORPV_631 [Orpheovirus IHUMI-LCC2]SNW62535.1 Hypothetical protein ORPV_631 [Orpheovirus IHUMI-LCC2]
MYTITNENNIVIAEITQTDYDLLLSKVPIFNLEGCNVQISDSYCGNVDNSKIALHYLLSLLNREDIDYVKDDIKHVIKLLSALCPELTCEDIIHIKKIMNKYDKLNILRNKCHWMFIKYHAIEIEEHPYSWTNDMVSVYGIYYYKDTFISSWRNVMYFKNAKTGKEKKLIFQSHDSMKDQNYYFIEDQLCLEKKYVSGQSEHYKFYFNGDNLPEVTTFINNKELSYIRDVVCTMSLCNFSLKDRDGDVLYEKKMNPCNETIAYNNNIIIRFDKSEGFTKIIKII